MSILAIGPSRKAKRYTSARAASRELSGDGSDRRRSFIVETAQRGGYVGNVWVLNTRTSRR